MFLLFLLLFRFVYVPAPYTKDMFSDILLFSLMDCNVVRKISTIIVDNCFTNDSLITCLLDKLNVNDLIIDGLVFKMGCAAHILNLIVKYGLDMISNAIERIRDSAVYWTASAARVKKFEEAVRQLCISCTKKLCLDCKIRWNSTFLMLQIVLI